jgi:hypothetical protein
MAINLKAAKVLGLTVPQSTLLSADGRAEVPPLQRGVRVPSAKHESFSL